MILMLDISVPQQVKGLKANAFYFHMDVEILPLP